MAIYESPAVRRFIVEVVEVVEVDGVHALADELASVDVVSYRDGEALNWHFDRAPFTTTLLLQQPVSIRSSNVTTRRRGH